MPKREQLVSLVSVLVAVCGLWYNVKNFRQASLLVASSWERARLATELARQQDLFDAVLSVENELWVNEQLIPKHLRAARESQRQWIETARFQHDVARILPHRVAAASERMGKLLAALAEEIELAHAQVGTIDHNSGTSPAKLTDAWNIYEGIVRVISDHLTQLRGEVTKTKLRLKQRMSVLQGELDAVTAIPIRSSGTVGGGSPPGSSR